MACVTGEHRQRQQRLEITCSCGLTFRSFLPADSYPLGSLAPYGCGPSSRGSKRPQKHGVDIQGASMTWRTVK